MASIASAATASVSKKEGPSVLLETVIASADQNDDDDDDDDDDNEKIRLTPFQQRVYRFVRQIPPGKV